MYSYILCMYIIHNDKSVIVTHTLPLSLARFLSIFVNSLATCTL